MIYLKKSTLLPSVCAYASRNSMQGASLKELKEEKFEFLFRAAIRLDVHDFLVSLSFSDDEIKLIEESLDIDTRKRFFKFQKSKHFRILKQNENFIKVYNNKKQSQNEALKKYFKEFNVDFKNEGLNIVDIGFNGTMQDFFNKFFQGDIKINGYYLASKKKGTNNSIKNGPCQAQNPAQGVLFYSCPFQARQASAKYASTTAPSTIRYQPKILKSCF